MFAPWSLVVHQRPPRPEFPPYQGYPGAANIGTHTKADFQCLHVRACRCLRRRYSVRHASHLQSDYYAVPMENSVCCILEYPVRNLTCHLSEPLSTVPIDLLFLHLILPYTLRYFRPKKIVKQAGVHVWKFLAMQLRLSSYLFGGRYSTEEYSLKKWTLRTLISTNLDDTEVLHDGTFRRVPNSDNVALLKDELATVEVDAEGVPVNDIEDRLMQRQNQEAEKAKRNIKDDYTITYMPPRFKYRVITFMVAIWMVCSIFLASSLAIPIIFGRFFFKLFVPYHVHDGYSFIAGFYLLWGCWLLNMVVERMDKHRQRRGGGEPRADLPLYFAKRSLLWLAKASYMTFFLGFVIPTLIAVVVELYIVMPFRQTFYPDMPPRIRIVDMWALGLLYTKIALQGPRVRPVGRITIGLERVRKPFISIHLVIS